MAPRPFVRELRSNGSFATKFANNSELFKQSPDIIEYSKSRPETTKEFLAQKHVQEGLSPEKIAKLIGRTRWYVMRKLREHKIYQPPIKYRIGLPFGKKWIRNKIRTSKSETKIIKQILTLHAKKFTPDEIAKVLIAQGLKSRSRTPWQAWMVKDIIDFELKNASNSKKLTQKSSNFSRF